VIPRVRACVEMESEGPGRDAGPLCVVRGGPRRAVLAAQRRVARRRTRRGPRARAA